ncbi:MAG: hypothetical protein Q7T87_15640 [Polaromonas sp.]|nr:hypothetical protein [Polaromonas sp.]
MQAFRISDRILNQALQAWLQPFPEDGQLNAWLATTYGDDLDRTQQKEVEVEAVRDAMKAVIRATEDVLWAEPGGVDWSGDFESRLRRQLTAAFPWLDDTSFGKLVQFSQWLCWHEGLNAPSTPVG